MVCLFLVSSWANVMDSIEIHTRVFHVIQMLGLLDECHSEQKTHFAYTLFHNHNILLASERNTAIEAVLVNGILPPVYTLLAPVWPHACVC